MSDYIKREDALRAIKESDGDIAISEDNVRELPAADVVKRELYERALSDVIKHRKGKWVREEVQTKEFGRLLVVKCSKCKKNQTYRTKYCSNCGAEMEGVSQ